MTADKKCTFRLSSKAQDLLKRLAEKLSAATGVATNKTDVLELAIRLMAKKEGVS